MADVFISYARSTAKEANRVAEALRGLGYGVWLDDELPAHRSYTQVIEEQLKSSKAVVVVWSAEAVKSEWVQSEADQARANHKLVQLAIDGAKLPMPFDRFQCADLAGWTGDAEAPGWRKVLASVADLTGGPGLGSRPGVESPQLPTKPSIAVLPFANLSGDPEQEYFADGMVVEITDALSRFKSIFVIASTSALTFKGKAVGAREAARQLGVRYVLEGSVRKAANRVRIAVQLVDAADGAQIWTHRFDDTLDDVFDLQDKVALSVAGVIEPKVQLAEVRRASKRPTENMDSYDLYLRALPLCHTWIAAEVFKALDMLDRAVALDPDFGPAMAQAALCHAYAFGSGWSEEFERHRHLGLELARRAIAVGSEDAEVLALVANSMMQLEQDLDAPATLIDRAMVLNPGSSRVWYFSGILKVALGEPELAVQHFEMAMRLDPLSRMYVGRRMFTGIARFQQARFADAFTLLKDVIEQTRSPLAPAFLAATCGHQGQVFEGQDALSRYREGSATPIETRARWGRPEHRKLFLDGIALAEERTPF
jgi:adenylate cyclase